MRVIRKLVLSIIVLMLLVGCSQATTGDEWEVYKSDEYSFKYPGNWVDVTAELRIPGIDIILADQTIPAVPSINVLTENTWSLLSANETIDSLIEMYEGNPPGMKDFKLLGRGDLRVGNIKAGYMKYEVTVTQTDTRTEQIQLVVPRTATNYYFTFTSQLGHFEDVEGTFNQIINSIEIK